jgi:uncharacterized protein with ATP-grasp and redox domains
MLRELILVPLAVARAVAGAPAALQRANETVVGSQEQLRLMHDQAELMLAQLKETHALAEKLLESVGPTVSEIQLTNEVANKLLTVAEPTTEQIRATNEVAERLLAVAEPTIEQIRATNETATRLLEASGPLLGVSGEATTALRAATLELSQANEQIARVVRIAEPLERAQRRGERISSMLRGPRDDEDGQPA